jgi:2-polyprenyl-3-methyl-5-hydroxy-6-metoxy-1,4-benzoquinol methylase
MTDWEQEQLKPGKERDATWYDNMFAGSEEYHRPYYSSIYYHLWTVIADRIRRSSTTGVLEIGCGPGQFASLLWEVGIKQYVGLDFSPKAVEMARQTVPGFVFTVGDARVSTVYETATYDILVCTEVLEHISDDLLIVSRFKPGCRCIGTVPSFPHASHVRFFSSCDEVRRRYGPYFRDFDIVTFKAAHSPGQVFYLFEGVRAENLEARR